MKKLYSIKTRGGRETRWPHVSALVSGSSGPGSSPGRGHSVVFLGNSPPRCINELESRAL